MTHRDESNRSRRVYGRRGVVLLDRRKHTIRLRMFDGGPAKLTLGQVRQLIVELAAMAGDLERSEARRGDDHNA